MTSKQEQGKEIIIKKQVDPIIADAMKLTIEKPADMEKATVVLSNLNKWNDRIVEEEEKITVPANLIIKNERARWAPTKKPLNEAIRSIRDKMSEYQTEEQRRVDEEEAKVAARVKEGKGNLSVATAMKKIAEIEKPEAKVETAAGSVGFRKDEIVKVLDKTMIPLEFMIIDETAILKVLKAGGRVAGCELDFKMVPINNR